MPALTLIVPTRDPGPELDGLVASIDAQAAPRNTFEVVFVDGGSTDGSSVRLERLAAARPNVQHLQAPADEDLTGLVRLGLEQADGDLVMVVRTGQRLTGQAVSLLEAAAAGGADAVLARSSSTPAGDGLPLADGPIEHGGAPRPGRGGVLAVRRAALEGSADPAAALLELAPVVPVAHDWDVVALGSVACLGLPWPDGGPVADGQFRWSGTELVVEAGLDPGDADAAAWLVLARVDATEELVLPAQVTDGADERLLATAAVDLAPAGALGDGVWSVRLRVRSGAFDQTSALTGAVPAAAVLQGRQVVPAVTAEGLSLDVGATRSSLVGRVSLGDARLAETARGALLTLSCRKVHVAGDSSSPVGLLLGRFRLPATLVCADGAARVESWVSGLAGRSRISIQTGGGKPRRTGLDLRIAGTGKMSLARTRRPTPPAAAVQVTGLKRLRGHVPSALEPVVRKLSHVGPLRAAYRLATRR